MIKMKPIPIVGVLCIILAVAIFGGVMCARGQRERTPSASPDSTARTPESTTPIGDLEHPAVEPEHPASPTPSAPEPTLSAPPTDELIAPPGPPGMSPYYEGSMPRPTADPMNHEVDVGNTDARTVALTMDCGASSTQTPAILDILRQNGVHVTFFITGRWAESNPELVARMIGEGHTIGNHTYSHNRLTECSDADILSEFSRTEEIISGIASGVTTKPYFRPPYGSRNQHVIDIAASEGYQCIYWTVDAWDWMTDATPDVVKNRIYDRLTNGAIIMMHVGDDITPAVLPEVINEIRDRGYTIGTLEDVLQ